MLFLVISLMTALLVSSIVFATANLCDDFLSRPPDLTYEVYKQWPNLNFLDRLKYILNTKELVAKYIDFLSFTHSNEDVVKYMQSPTCPSEELQHMITYQHISDKLSEFLSPQDLFRFFNACDLNKDKVLSFFEYLECRGDYDLNGHLIGSVNEYIKRESELIDNYETYLSTSSSSSLHPQYIYDENGIIID